MKGTPGLSPFEAGGLGFVLPSVGHWLWATLHEDRDASQDVALVMEGNSLRKGIAVSC